MPCMKILIIAFYYPPEESWAKMASLRPKSWAKYWSRMGHQVYVLTTYRQIKLSQDNNEHVIGVKYWPSRSTIPLSVTSSSQPLAEVKTLKLRLSSLMRSIFKGIREKLGLGSFLQASDFWLIPALINAFRLERQIGFDLVVSTYGPPANHIVAGLLKRAIRKPFWVADYRDLWHGNDYSDTSFLISMIENRVEDFFISKANLITTVSEGISKELKRRFKVDVETFENGFDIENLDQINSLSWPDSKKRLMYSGAIYPGKRDPKPLFTSLRMLQSKYPDLTQRLEILFYVWDTDSLQRSMVGHEDLNGIIKVCQPKPHAEILSLQRSVDALIFLDWKEPSVNGILTGKIYEYIFAGKPIFGIGATPETAAGQLILDLGVGYLVGSDSKAIAEILELLLEGKQLLYFPKTAMIQRYTRENIAQTMLTMIINKMTR